jgi:phytoene/squalene synthetase
MLSSILFDAERREEGRAITQAERAHNLFRLDIQGTIGGMLKINREDPDAYVLLEPLGTATRIYYDLRDHGTDVKQGFLNIPLNEWDRLGITRANIGNTTAPGVQQWFREEAERGLDLLAQHQQNLRAAKFRPLTRLALHVQYERPTRRHLEGVLSTVDRRAA